MYNTMYVKKCKREKCFMTTAVQLLCLKLKKILIALPCTISHLKKIIGLCLLLLWRYYPTQVCTYKLTDSNKLVVSLS